MTRTRVVIVAAVAVGVVAAAWLLPVAEWITRLAERARGTGPLGVGGSLAPAAAELPT